MRDIMKRSQLIKSIAKSNKELKSFRKKVSEYERLNDTLRDKEVHTDADERDFELNCELIDMYESKISQVSESIERFESQLKSI